MITVRYFAAARERAGCDREEVPAVSTLGALVEQREQAHPGLAPIRPHLRFAVNQEFVDLSAPLADGDEVAFIPPVAGGAGAFSISAEPLQLQQVVSAVEGESQGGLVTFSGAVRNQTKGRAVVRLEYEAYTEMAIAQMEVIGTRALAQWPGVRLAISHRVGVLVPGELAVVIAASSPHRAEAFEACRFAIEELKRDVPIWKREVFADGQVWVGLGP